MAGGKACQLESTLRTRRTVVRKSEAMINLKAHGDEELQTQQARKDNFSIHVHACANLS
jgi:hypothetical protein